MIGAAFFTPRFKPLLWVLCLFAPGCPEFPEELLFGAGDGPRDLGRSDTATESDLPVADSRPVTPDLLAAREEPAADLAAAPDLPSSPDSLPCTSWKVEHFDPCLIPAPGAPLSLTSNHTFNTDSGTFTAGPPPITPPTLILSQTGQNARLISVGGLTIAAGARLRIVGSLPLVVASAGDISVAGELDGSSGGSGPGAGANPALCAGSAGKPGKNDSEGASGAGGGGFRAAGGAGGTGDSNTSPSTGGAGGTQVSPPAIVRGGCPGGRGGDADKKGGAGGAGGGAVVLASKTRISVTGTIHAGGAGGAGSDTAGRGGGGGGGSGGLIGLDAPEVIVNGAVVAANGGGGGEGADLGSGIKPRDGEDGLESASAAQGGAGGPPSGGDGGNGGAGNSPAGQDGQTAPGGGGGGGGGGGFVLVWTTKYTPKGGQTVTPPAQVTIR